MKKEIIKVFLVVIFYALSAGIFLNFQELWLQSNNIDLSTVGLITSSAIFLSIGVIFIFSNYISPNKIKPFLEILLLANTICIITLYFLNNTDNLFLIKLFDMISYILNVEILTAMYPLLTTFKKNDKLYALKDLIYESAYNIGVILSSILIGKSIGKFVINYNSYLLISAILSFITLIILFSIKRKKVKETKSPDVIFIKILKKSFKKPVLKNYVIYKIFCQLAYYSVIGMILSFFISGLNLTEDYTFKWRIISLLLASVVGFVGLKFTPKKDIDAIIIKFGARIFLYLIVVIYPCKLTILITVTYVFLTSLVFSDVIDGKYVNLYANNEQLSFANFSYMLISLSRALGTYICSLAITYNIRINFICALIFTILQFVYLNKASKLLEIENDNK